MDKKDILKHIGGDSGMTTPDGYFSDFAARMTEALPRQDWENQKPAIAPPKTWWERCRAYVYMAAMFAGVWLMMNMFSLFKSSTPEEQLASNTVLAEALADDAFVDDLYLDDNDDLDEMLDDLYAQGITVDDLRESLLRESNI